MRDRGKDESEKKYNTVLEREYTIRKRLPPEHDTDTCRKKVCQQWEKWSTDSRENERRDPIWKCLYQIEDILDKDESKRDEERKDEEVPARESELFRGESNTREMLEGLFDRCREEKSSNRSENRQSPFERRSEYHEWVLREKSNSQEKCSMEKGYLSQKDLRIDWSSCRRSPDEYEYRRQQEHDSKYSHESRTFEYISEEIDHQYRESSSDHAIDESDPIPLVMREHIHSISPEEYRKECKEEKNDARANKWQHLAFFNDLIASECPFFLTIGIISLHERHGKEKCI